MSQSDLPEKKPTEPDVSTEPAFAANRTPQLDLEDYWAERLAGSVRRKVIAYFGILGLLISLIITLFGMDRIRALVDEQYVARLETQRKQAEKEVAELSRGFEDRLMAKEEEANQLLDELTKRFQSRAETGVEKLEEFYEAIGVKISYGDTILTRSGFTERVYTADFNKWSVSSTEHGTTQVDAGGSYVLQPTSNTWIGSGEKMEIPRTQGDFLLDVKFRIEKRNPSASLALHLSGAGPNVATVDVFFSLWDKDNATYSLQKGQIKNDFYAITDQQVANREQIPTSVMAHDWTKTTQLVLKREGTKMTFVINNNIVKEFDVSAFAVGGIGVGAAFQSRIVITSIEAWVKE